MSFSANSQGVIEKYNFFGQCRALGFHSDVFLSFEHQAAKGDSSPPKVFSERGEDSRVVHMLLVVSRVVDVRVETWDMEVGVLQAD